MTNKEQKYCLFFDWDFTVSFKGVSQANIDALSRLKKAGHKIILNTGRSRAYLPEEALKIDWDGLICGTAYIELDKQVLCDEHLKKETLISAYNFAKKHDLFLIYEGTENVYSIGSHSLALNIEDEFDYYMENKYDEMKVTKFVIGANCEGYTDCSFPGVWIVFHPTYTEMLPNGFDKSTGIKMICDKLNIPIENTISFGDSMNDLAMLKYTKQSVIMHCAPEELDKYATYRTTTDKEGVAEAINRLVFGE